MDWQQIVEAAKQILGGALAIAALAVLEYLRRLVSEWLERIREERVRDAADEAVQAAEQLARVGDIEAADRLTYVQGTLCAQGIEPEEKVVEAAVHRLNLEKGTV